MADLQILKYNVGEIGTNCYFLVNKDTKETIIIDPGGDGLMLEREIESKGLKPVAILLTHAHYDHAHHAKLLKDDLQIPIYAHEAEKKTMADPEMTASTLFGIYETYDADIFLKDENDLDLAGFHFKVLFTPGHTPGGVSFYLPEFNAVFCGDTLFNGSVGRTDFPGGSMSQLVRSIREKLLVLPPDTTVYPGHLPETTIAQEEKYNPFL